MMKLAVAGAVGRTGRRVVELAVRETRFEVTAALTGEECPRRGSNLEFDGVRIPVTSEWKHPCDVLVDFSVPQGTTAWLAMCLDRGIPMVTGVTGHSADQLAAIETASGVIPIVKASNFSIGVNLLLDLVGRVAKELGDEFDAEIVETHHRHKVDAPSGTALAILDEILSATGRTREEDAVFGRHGQTVERPKRQIGVHAVRGGEIVGAHEIHFHGLGETLTLSHTAHSRDTFAAGALRAAAWVVGKSPGLYAMRDVTSTLHSS